MIRQMDIRSVSFDTSFLLHDKPSIDKVIKLLAEMKKQGKSVRFICPNAHANAQREKDSI